jgi:hypothetical protein
VLLAIVFCNLVALSHFDPRRSFSDVIKLL